MFDCIAYYLTYLKEKAAFMPILKHQENKMCHHEPKQEGQDAKRVRNAKKRVRFTPSPSSSPKENRPPTEFRDDKLKAKLDKKFEDVSFSDLKVAPYVLGPKRHKWQHDAVEAQKKGQYAVEMILGQRKRKVGRQMITEYRVKWENYDLNCDGQEQWLEKWQFGDSTQIIDEYLLREKRMKSILKPLMENTLHVSQEEFEVKYPLHSRRQDYECEGSPVTKHQRYMLELREFEAKINQEQALTGQAPVYIENWTNHQAPLTYKHSANCSVEISTALANLRPVPLVSCKCTRGCGAKCPCAATYANVNSPDVKENGALCTKSLKSKKDTLIVCGPDCSCDENCPRRTYQFGRQFPVMLFFINEKKGWGIIAMENIPGGECMGQYMGEIQKRDSSEDVKYCFDIVGANEKNNNFCINARNIGSETRFFNHACKPTMVVLNVYVGSNISLNSVVFFTKKNVKKGSECTFYYAGVGKNSTGGRCLCSPDCKARL